MCPPDHYVKCLRCGKKTAYMIETPKEVRQECDSCGKFTLIEDKTVSHNYLNVAVGESA